MRPTLVLIVALLTTTPLPSLAGLSGPSVDGDPLDTNATAPPPGTAMDGEQGTVQSDRAVGDARVLATAPMGFYYEGITYDGGRVFAGTAFGATGQFVPATGLNEPSRVYVHDRASGALVDTILFEGEDTTRPHGAVGLKTDAAGRLYALSSQLGLLRFTEGADGWMQEDLVQLPDIPPCSPFASAPCSPTLDDDVAIGNDMTWDAAGNLYISDSFQATIWRLAPDRTLDIWYQHEALDRAFGPNGLRVSPDGTRMALAVTGPDSVEAGPLMRGSKIFSIPFPDPAAGELETLFTLPNGDYADGIVYGETGDLYVLSNSGNRVYILRDGAGEVDVISNDDLSGPGFMDFPASAVFDGAGALLIANYAYFDGQANEAGRTVIDVFFDDAGLPEPRPDGIH